MLAAHGSRAMGRVFRRSLCPPSTQHVFSPCCVREVAERCSFRLAKNVKSCETPKVAKLHFSRGASFLASGLVEMRTAELSASFVHEDPFGLELQILDSQTSRHRLSPHARSLQKHMLRGTTDTKGAAYTGRRES